MTKKSLKHLLQDVDVAQANFLNVTNEYGNTTYYFTIENPEAGIFLGP
jgi:hypothetical protein